MLTTLICPQCGGRKSYGGRTCRPCYHAAFVLRTSLPRACTKCGATKEPNDFPPRSGIPGSRNTRCRECVNEKNRHPKERKRTGDYRRQKKYGMSEEQYEAMLDKQSGLCAVCGGPPSSNRADVLFVDHDHTTGMVRGLLCHNCNVGIGFFRDQPSTLRAAAGYIEANAQFT